MTHGPGKRSRNEGGVHINRLHVITPVVATSVSEWKRSPAAPTSLAQNENVFVRMKLRGSGTA